MPVNLATITTLNRVRLYQGQPGTSVSTVYTVPASTDVAIKAIVLCNTTFILPIPTGFTATAVGSGGTFAAATYYWKIAATDVLGETVPSTEASATIALNGSANLAWTAVSGATGYRIYRSTTTGAQTGATSLVTVIGSGATTTYTDTGTATTTGSVLATATATAANAAVTLHVVPSGGTAVVGNQVLAALTVPTASTATVDTTIYMTTGDFLAVLQGTSGAITVTVSGETYA